MIRKAMKTMEEDITTDFNQNVDSVKELILDQRARSRYEDKQTKKAVSDVQRNLIQVKESLNELISKFDHALNSGHLSNKIAR